MAVEKGGCFSGSGLVTTADGVQKPMAYLRPGEEVLSLSESGEIVLSRVLLFLHLDRESRTTFLIFTTENGKRMALTPNHLIFAAPNLKLHHHEYEAIFAKKVRTGDYILTTGDNRGLQPSKVVSISLQERMGVYAPLTEHGNLFVDGVLVSNYASVEDHRLAHWAFWPFHVLFRFFHRAVEENSQRVVVKSNAMVSNICSTDQTFHTDVMHNSSSSICKKFTVTVETENEHRFLQQKEVYWYARLLHTLGQIFLDPHKFY